MDKLQNELNYDDSEYEINPNYRVNGRISDIESRMNQLIKLLISDPYNNDILDQLSELESEYYQLFKILI